ncbi:MAG: hypothetical protein BAJALOKI2v1_40059 [Promethearchaeota archaeon]|nr:MAG: hypothetical protein BAJALOKI2v1_40059 [Candidatus Lokiarchaeota archaeon]
MAITDHAEIMLYNPTALNDIESSTNQANDPNNFVAFQGIEYTNVETGHYICIFEGEQLLKSPVLDSYFIVKKPNQLWSILDNFTYETNTRALALPHHTTKKSYMQDWTYVNPKYVKLAEVTSVHGECLFEQRHELN